MQTLKSAGAQPSSANQLLTNVATVLGSTSNVFNTERPNKVRLTAILLGSISIHVSRNRKRTQLTSNTAERAIRKMAEEMPPRRQGRSVAHRRSPSLVDQAIPLRNDSVIASKPTPYVREIRLGPAGIKRTKRSDEC